MGKKFKVKDLTTNEIYEIDEDELTGPVKIQKPSRYVTPDKASLGSKNFSSASHKHHTIKELMEEAEKLAEYIEKHGLDD